MVSGRRLLSIWFALHLSVGSGLMALTQALRERIAVSLPVVVGSVGALLTAIVLLHRYPEPEFSVIRRFGFLTIVLFIVGNVVIADGIYAPPGESSPLTIGFLWFVSMTVAYGVNAGGGYAWLSKRVTFR